MKTNSELGMGARKRLNRKTGKGKLKAEPNRGSELNLESTEG